MVATAQRRWLAWQQRWQLGRSAVLAVSAARLEVQRQRGSGGGNKEALAAVAWRMLTIIAMVTMTTMIDY